MSNYPLRLPETLMADAREMAEAEGVSINQFLAILIAERIGELKALGQLKTRVSRADPVKARAIFARAPARRPVKGDEMPAVRRKK